MRVPILLIALISTSSIFSQSFTSFEVITIRKYSSPGSSFKANLDSIKARINAIPDSATMLPTLVYTVDNTADIDSLEFSLTNGNNELVYQVKNSVTALSATGLLRITDKTFYLNPGSFSFLKRFSATARSKDKNGAYNLLKEFRKN